MKEPSASARAILGVKRSALGRPWRPRLDQTGEAQALAITQIHGTGDLLARVLAGQGVSHDCVPDYLDPSLRKLLPDPNSLKDMDAASERIAGAVMRGENIAVLGDYDVDGACASALLKDYFRACGTTCRIYIPDRITEGYGPNAGAISRLAQAGARLLITVDCGTLSHEPLGEAARLRLEPVVLDHHPAGEELPEAIVVNPNRQDDLSGLGYLCAAGVVFLTLIAVQRKLRQWRFFSAARPEPDLRLGLDLAALATVADVVPLRGLNRALVRKGLPLIAARRRPGLRALCDAARLREAPTPYHLGFILGPRINAGGRIGDAALGARLLASADPLEAGHIASELERLNRERQELERVALEEAEAVAIAGGANPAVVIAASRGWHPGINGLIAARLNERFRRPAFAIALSREGIGIGSGRSIAGADLGRAVRAAAEDGIILKGGGHPMAAGISIASSQLEAFKDFLEARLASSVAAARAEDAVLIDGLLSACAATPELIASLSKAGPFGADNPEPVFAFAAHRLAGCAAIEGGHMRFRAVANDGAAISGIAFRAAQEPLGRALYAARGSVVHFAGNLIPSRYGGREQAQLRLIDFAPDAACSGLPLA